VAESVGASGLDAYWAVAEADGLGDPIWSGLPRIAQGRGSLGERMARVHTDLVERHGAAILVGADLPQMEPADLQRAAEWLDRDESRQALGAALDGGFWLFGSNRVHARNRWQSVTYSAVDTARRFIAAIGGGEWRMLQARTDLDRAGDLGPVLEELRALDRPNRSQHRMIDWLARALEKVA
jgi:glycosyltransferase A (GT-A) superfamily protein (DUF2064 family)